MRTLSITISLFIILGAVLCSHASPLPISAKQESANNEMNNARTDAMVQAGTATYRFAVNTNGFPVSPMNLGYGLLNILGVSPGLLGTAFDTTTISAVDFENNQSLEKRSIIYNEQDKQTSQSESASVTGSGYGATVSAQASYLNEITTSTTSTHYTLAFQQSIKDTELDLSSIQLTTSAIKLLNEDAQSFVNKWGRYFISSCTTGCNVNAFVSLETHSESDMNELNAELQESYNEGVFTAQGSQTYEKAVNSSSISSTTSGQATVVGVAAPSDINPTTPTSIYQYKEYVAEHCTTGSIVTATLSNFLSVPSVLNAITNSSAIDVLSENTILSTQVTDYWNIVMQLTTTAKDANSCAADINKCLTLAFLYDSTTEEKNMNEFYSTVSGTLNDLLALGNSYDGIAKIAADPSILTGYQTQANEYSNQYTTLISNLEPINFSRVNFASDEGSAYWGTPKSIEVSYGMNGVNNEYYDHNSKVIAYGHMNYGVESSSGESYIVMRADCLNGESVMSCYTMDDVQAAVQKNDNAIVLDMAKCSSSGDPRFYAQISNKVPPAEGQSNGSFFGRQCPSDISTTLMKNFPQAGSKQFCAWSSSVAPFYVDGTAPACDGSCGHNWDCGKSSSGSSCVTGYKKKCLHKNNI
eukprot:Nk52_evm40s2506 gene=Nk52_evmTU40s2506